MTADEIEINQIVERAFDANRKRRGEICEIPIVGGDYIPGLDRTKRLKEKACRALAARQWFITHGPTDAPPLPLSHNEREALKSGGLPHIVAWYARSLWALDYNVQQHASFDDYARGVMASEEYAPDFIRKNEELQRRFPPRFLKGLG